MPTLDLLQTNTSSICFHGTCCTSRTLISIHSPSEAGDVRDGGEVSVCTDMEEGESKLFKGNVTQHFMDSGEHKSFWQSKEKKGWPGVRALSQYDLGLIPGLDFI